jgi:hypothetical protein
MTKIPLFNFEPKYRNLYDPLNFIGTCKYIGGIFKNYKKYIVRSIWVCACKNKAIHHVLIIMVNYNTHSIVTPFVTFAFPSFFEC